MGWAGPMPNAQGRMVGYAQVAQCDLDGCRKRIDRGLAYCCGGMHDGGEHGCGDYFCAKHLFYGAPESLCAACLAAWEKDHVCPECGEELNSDGECPDIDCEDAAATTGTQPPTED